MEKIYRVQMNSSGMPNFATAEEIDDEFKNFDRESLILLIEAQKERIGELIADRPQGEWIDAEIPLESGGSMPIQACNLCKTFYPLAYTGGGHRFCPNCGARMKGADDE